MVPSDGFLGRDDVGTIWLIKRETKLLWATALGLGTISLIPALDHYLIFLLIIYIIMLLLYIM